MKDKNSLFYNRIDRIYNAEPGTLSDLFGYKCKLTRDFKEENKLYDIITPILIKDGLFKINKQKLSSGLEFIKLKE